jgi:hypothetical protein
MLKSVPLIRLIALALLVSASAPAFAAILEPITFYVAPDGSDAFTGRLPRRNAQKSDGPLATLSHARDVARGLRQADADHPSRPAHIILRGGTYYLNQPLELAPEDSNTVWSASENEKPVISAGLAVHGWDKGKLNGHDVWMANIPQLRDSTVSFDELWVNGQRRLLARSPNKGYFLAGDVPDLDKKTLLQTGQHRFHYKNDDLHAWEHASEAEAVVLSLWAESHLPVESIDEKEHLVTFTKDTVHKMAPDDKYFIQGIPELLDEPGEWYFDRKQAMLYYMPMPGEEMLRISAVVPRLAQIVRMTGAPDKGQFVRNVTFHGITFSNSEWYVPRDAKPPIKGMKPAGFNQAEWGVPAAIQGEGVQDCLFEDCTISHAGNYGIELGRGCQRNKISYCTMTDLGAGGIKIGTTSSHFADADATTENEISDCTIADCGRIFPSCIGLWIGQSPHNLISHNDIHGLYYTGISIGWTWGYGTSLARDNIVEYNHVHHCGSSADGEDPILSDMGAIYTLGKQPGTIIRFNHFHHIAGLRYGGWGIYFDEGSSDILAENNLVHHTTHGGFHQHYGENNVVRNNIFAYGRDAQIQRTRVEDHLSFRFEDNLVLFNTGSLLHGNWSKMNVVFDHNTYWHPGGPDFKFDTSGKLTEEAWKKAGMDAHSQWRDPGFVDLEKDNFQLKPGAEKELLGFVPFDVSSAGPRRRGH